MYCTVLKREAARRAFHHPLRNGLSHILIVLCRPASSSTSCLPFLCPTATALLQHPIKLSLLLVSDYLAPGDLLLWLASISPRGRRPGIPTIAYPLALGLALALPPPLPFPCPSPLPFPFEIQLIRLRRTYIALVYPYGCPTNLVILQHAISPHGRWLIPICSPTIPILASSFGFFGSQSISELSIS